jgi:hypothetical protein
MAAGDGKATDALWVARSLHRARAECRRKIRLAAAIGLAPVVVAVLGMRRSPRPLDSGSGPIRSGAPRALLN